MEMENRGVLINQDLAQEQIEIGNKRMAEIRNYLGGLNPSSPNDLYTLLCENLGLPEIIQVKTGRRTFDKKAMEEYDVILERMDSPIAKRVLEYRGWQKTVTSNYEPYLELLSPDGRLRCNYKLHGTVTGRNSCERPNLQQIPRESSKEWNGHLKSAFIAPPGKSIIEFDYAQLELRLGTAYADEKSLIQVFAEDRDIFQEMADAFGWPRFDTKTFTYSIQYGAGVNRISNVFGISRQQAKGRIDTYYSTYPAFRAISNRVGQIVTRHGKVPLWSGRFRHFLYPESQSYKAFNSLIQGGAADIVERVMLALKPLETKDSFILLTIHDSVVWEIADEERERLVPLIKETMEDVNGATGQKFGVKFAVDYKEWGK
jgi:DNA polymerase-1